MAWNCRLSGPSITGSFRTHPAVRDVVDLVFEATYLTASRAIDATGRSRQAVYDAIEALEEREIVAAISDAKGYRVYQAPVILSVVASP